MLKLGLLMSNKGRFNKEKIVSEDWINESTNMHIDKIEWGNEGYGYHWWLEKPGSNNNDKTIIYAQGMGFQLIMIVPESNRVIVVTGGIYSGMEKNMKLWEEIHELI
jgi:CubicO group peptidase (beta-lactamase class C family)